MTVANETARTSATGTNAAGQEIAFSFPINASSDLTVYTRVTATGVEATLTETADYTVSISGDIGGTVTLVSALPVTYTCHVERNTPRTQSLDLETGGTFNGENIEDALDKAMRAINDLYDKWTRAIVIPATDSTSLSMELDNSVDRASNYLAFDSDGQPTVVSSVAPTTAIISAYGESLIAVANEAALKTLINAEAGVDFQAYSAYLTAMAALARTDGNVIVGNGTTWVAESGATLRTSIGTLAETEACRVDASHAYTGTGVGFRDEDDMLSNDATAPPSQQSVKAFVNSIVGYDGDVVMYLDEVCTYV